MPKADAAAAPAFRIAALSQRARFSAPPERRAMIRTFIAAEINEDVADGLANDIASLKTRFPRVKWSRPENLHLTLKFLGDVKERDLEELFDALTGTVTGLAPFALEVKGFGAFPGWRHPRVIRAGCGEGSEDAAELANAVETACDDLGYEREKRPYRPHLTLGRVTLPADAAGMDAEAAKLMDKTYGFVDIDAVTVFMSSLGRAGPVYSPMARIPLGGDGA